MFYGEGDMSDFICLFACVHNSKLKVCISILLSRLAVQCSKNKSCVPAALYLLSLQNCL